MYTDTTRPNHLAHEVIDNSVDEAIVGYCKSIRVTLYKDNSLEIVDDGRGMPVDIHPVSYTHLDVYKRQDMYPGMAKQAREEGFSEIADWFETLAKAERSHANRFQKALDSL